MKLRRHVPPVDAALVAARAELVAAVRTAAPAWFGATGGRDVDVEVLEHAPRSSSVLSVLRVRVGDDTHDVVVKQALPVDPAPPPDRPLLSDGYSSVERLVHEVDALRLVERHLGTGRSSGFRPIHVFGEVPGHTAFAMERIVGGSLRDLSRRRSWRRAPGLAARYEAAGAWLRTYHQIPVAEDLPVLRATHDEVAEAMRVVTEFVARLRGRRSIARRLQVVGHRAEVVAGRLPARPTLGLRHDDFAPRNVLVDVDDMVVVIDVLARQRAPIHEDLAQFLMWTETTKVWLLTGGRHVGRTARRLGDAALRGYFGPDVPRRDLWVFEVLAHLDRLAAWYETAGRQRQWKPVRRIGHWFGERATVRRLEDLLDQIEAG